MASRSSRARKLIPSFLVVANAFACGEIEQGDPGSDSAGSVTKPVAGGTGGSPIETAGNSTNPPQLFPGGGTGGTGGVPGTSGTHYGTGGTNPPGFGSCPAPAPADDQVCFISSETTCVYDEAGCSMTLACVGTPTGQRWSTLATTCPAGGAGGAPEQAGGAPEQAGGAPEQAGGAPERTGGGAAGAD